MDASHITVENVASVIGVGLVAAVVAARKYLAQLKAPAAASASDVIVTGAAFTDVKPFKDMVEIGHLLLIENKRIANAAERIAKVMEENAEEEEIERRANAKAADITARSRRRP